MFFDRHKWEDMKEYRERFLYKIKLLLPYFEEFSEDCIIVSKEYPNDCARRGPEKDQSL